MLFFFRQRRPPYLGGEPPAPRFGASLLALGLLCVFFGLAILAAPELLAYFVASFLIVIGASLLALWFRIRQ